MNPSESDVLAAIKSGSLVAVLRGDLLPYTTPAEINDDMRPTDHVLLLEQAIYPLALQYGVSLIQGEFERALRDACSDALGVFCALRCFYLGIRQERRGASPLRIDRDTLPRLLAVAFLRESAGLHALKFHPTDSAGREYRSTLAGMITLDQKCHVDWGTPLPSL